MSPQGSLLTVSLYGLFFFLGYEPYWIKVLPLRPHLILIICHGECTLNFPV